MSLSDTDKREVCPLHGWVGRRVFQQDRHDLCESPSEDLLDADDEEALSPDDVAVDEGGLDAEALDALDGEDPDEDPDAIPVDAGGKIFNGTSSRWSRAEARRQGIPSKKTLAVRRITQVELAAGRAELQAIGADEPYARPRTRSDCANIPRPCPYIACKYSLYLDVSETGSIILNFPHLEPGQMPAEHSCALDIADRGAMTLEDIAVVTNLTRERIRQIELKALVRRARPAAIAMGLGPDDAAAIGGGHHVGPGADLEETGVEGAVPGDVGTLLSGGGGNGDS